MFKEYFKGIWRDRYILFNLVNKDLQLKYRQSKLGVAWAILTPLGLALIIGSVYSILFGADPKEFIPLLFAGLNPWLFISATADSGTIALINAEGYLKQTTVNAQIFPLRTTLVNFINLLYSILTFFSIYLFLQPLTFSAKMLFCIPGLILLFFFALGLANLSSIINLELRDYQPLQSLILQGLFYVTPIIYQPEMLQEKGFEILYQINPLYYLITIVRTPVQGKEFLAWKIWIIAILLTITLFFSSVLIIMKHREKIVFKL